MTSDSDKNRLVHLGVSARPDLQREVITSVTGIEGLVIDNAKGTLVTLVNWSEAPAKAVTVQVRIPFQPTSARQVSAQKSVPVTYANGVATFTLDLAQAEYVLLNK